MVGNDYIPDLIALITQKMYIVKYCIIAPKNT